MQVSDSREWGWLKQPSLHTFSDIFQLALQINVCSGVPYGSESDASAQFIVKISIALYYIIYNGMTVDL